MAGETHLLLRLLKQTGVVGPMRVVTGGTSFDIWMSHSAVEPQILTRVAIRTELELVALEPQYTHDSVWLMAGGAISSDHRFMGEGDR
ncbi:MAG: hypothetical protein WBN62_10590, partial [Thermoanaerobaculia bacterium]